MCFFRRLKRSNNRLITLLSWLPLFHTPATFASHTTRTQVQHAASVHGAHREGGGTLVETMASDVPGNSGTATSEPHPPALPGAGGTAAVAAAGRIRETSGVVERGDIPNITMEDAFRPSHKAYRRATEILMMLNSYYLAFYAVYFISRASKSSTEWVWIIVLPLPILCGVLMAYRRVLPLIALLSTIVVMQPTDVADVRECCKARGLFVYIAILVHVVVIAK